MKRRYWIHAILLSALCQIPATQADVLGKDEILEQFTNMEVSGHHDKKNYDFTRRYYGDGKLTGSSSAKGERKGTWRVSRRGLCEKWDDKKEKCRRLEQADVAIKGYNKSGVLVASYQTFTPLPDPARVNRTQLTNSGSGTNKGSERNDVNKPDKEGKTPLHLAALNDRYGEAVDLVESGAGLDIANKSDGATPLIYAAQSGSNDIVGFMLDKGARVNHETHAGDDALRLAVLNGHRDVAQLLIAHGADVNSGSFVDTTPLINAAIGGFTAIGKLLIDSGADSNLPDNQGNTPLMVAALKGDLAFSKMLLEHGADAKARNKQGQSVIFFAAFSGNHDLVQTLIRRGADANMASDSGRTPVHTAAIAEKDAVLRVLFDSGYAPPATTWDSEEDLFAAGYSYARYGEYLEARSADTDSAPHYAKARDLFYLAAEQYDAIAGDYSDQIFRRHLGNALSSLLAGAAASYQASINTLPTPDGGVVGFGHQSYWIHGTGDLPELRELYSRKAERARELGDHYQSMLIPPEVGDNKHEKK